MREMVRRVRDFYEDVNGPKRSKKKLYRQVSDGVTGRCIVTTDRYNECLKREDFKMETTLNDVAAGITGDTVSVNKPIFDLLAAI